MLNGMRAAVRVCIQLADEDGLGGGAERALRSEAYTRYGGCRTICEQVLADAVYIG
jgi:hypothetical protein